MSTVSKLSKLRYGCDKFATAEVERFAHFAAEIPRKVGLLQDGQTLLLDSVKQGNIGARAGAHAGRGSRRESLRYPGTPVRRQHIRTTALVSGGLFNGMAGEIFAKSRGELLQAGVNILVHGFDDSLHSLALGRLIVFVFTRPNGGACFGIE